MVAQSSGTRVLRAPLWKSMRWLALWLLYVAFWLVLFQGRLPLAFSILLGLGAVACGVTAIRPATLANPALFRFSVRFDRLLFASYGLKAEALAELLEEWRRRHQ